MTGPRMPPGKLADALGRWALSSSVGGTGFLWFGLAAGGLLVPSPPPAWPSLDPCLPIQLPGCWGPG